MCYIAKNFALFIIRRFGYSVDFIYRPKEENKSCNIRLISISENRTYVFMYKNKPRYKISDPVLL